MKLKHKKWLANFAFDAVDTVLNIIITIGIVFFIRSFVVTPFQINGSSMDNTMHHNEYIIVSKISYSNLLGFQFGAPKRGDIVVFRPPINREVYYIKRVIGLSGETLKFTNEGVIVYNKESQGDKILKETYVQCLEQTENGPVNHCDYSGLLKKEFKVPEGHYFVMGDNRNNSTDSRQCFYSCNSPEATNYVPRANIVGKTALVAWPFHNFQVIHAYNYQPSQ
ncbi:signal peptidase I [Candidatus Peregrinibacteria bacterium CG1_02_41_10]|nr:MAG: signal peptidase I [Candidatus Peregrinibacteria bacterium CG1_02_41_10]